MKAWMWAFVAAGCGGSSSATDAAGGDGPVGCSDGSGWSAAPGVLGGAIQETAVVALDGKIFVLGGFDGASRVVSSVRIFDTAACTWSDGPALPRPIHHGSATVANGTIYVLGAMDGLTFTPIGDVFAWNPTTQTAWSTKTSMPVGSQRGAAVAGAIGDTIYVAGGLASGALTTFSAYSTTADTWDTNLPPLPQPRDHGCGGVVGGKLYVVGGRMATTTTNSALVFEYTPGGAWVQKASMPTARGGIACGIGGDTIIVAGGEGNRAVASGVFPQLEAYTVSADRWDSLPPMTTPRHGMGAAISGTTFYVPGGATKEGFGAVDTHEAFRF